MALTVVYETPDPNKVKHRYVVHYLYGGNWFREEGPGYRTKLFAKFNARLWESLNKKAKVIDTRATT